MDDMTFLTPSEVRILTGRAHKEPQKAVLRANGIPYFVNAAGWAIVARTAVEGGKLPAPATPKWSPVRGQAQHTS